LTIEQQIEHKYFYIFDCFSRFLSDAKYKSFLYLATDKNPQPLRKAVMTKKSKLILISACVALVPVMMIGVICAGYLFFVSRDGESRQEALGEQYDTLYNSIGLCLGDNHGMSGLPSDLIISVGPHLIAVAMTQFVNEQGEPLYQRFPEDVEPAVARAIGGRGEFTEADISDFSEMVILCGGSNSRIYDAAVEFKEWTEDNSFFVDRIVRSRYPSRDFDVMNPLSDFRARGDDALDMLTARYYPGGDLRLV
jgi:hypothetical protein